MKRERPRSLCVINEADSLYAVIGHVVAGERVVVDGEALPASHTPIGGSIPRAERGALHQQASYWRISDLEIVNGPYGVYCDGCYANRDPRKNGARAVAHNTLRNSIGFKNAAHGVTDNGNPSFADGRPVALGSTSSSGNSWDLGGAWGEPSVLRTDTSAITGPRGADGSLPAAPNFLVPRDGTRIGARL